MQCGGLCICRYDLHRKRATPFEKGEGVPFILQWSLNNPSSLQGSCNCSLQKRFGTNCILSPQTPRGAPMWQQCQGTQGYLTWDIILHVHLQFGRKISFPTEAYDDLVRQNDQKFVMQFWMEEQELSISQMMIKSSSTIIVNPLIMKIMSTWEEDKHLGAIHKKWMSTDKNTRYKLAECLAQRRANIVQNWRIKDKALKLRKK